MRRPRFIARQAGCPSGIVGRAIAAIMVRETAETNRDAIAALEVRTGEHVLDVGCGGGHGIELLIPLVGHGSVSGVDPSPLMVSRARRRNACHLIEDRVVIETAAVERLPFVDETFDAAMSVHTLYFWENLSRAFAEIHRVLRPGGRLVLALRTPANEAAVTSFPSDVYRFRSLAEVAEAIEAAGLTVTTTTSDGENGEPALLAATKPSAQPQPSARSARPATTS